MRHTPSKPGFSLQTLLYIAVLCGVIALVPALAAGVKHASSAVFGTVRVERAKPPTASAGDASGLRIWMGSAAGQPRSWCSAVGDGGRRCRV